MPTSDALSAETLAWLDTLHDERAVVVVRDPQIGTTFVSSNCAAVFGWSTEEFGARVFSLVEPDDQAKAFELFTSMIERGRPHVRFAVRMSRPDGSRQLVDFLLLNRLDDPELGVVAVLHPVGEAESADGVHVGLLANLPEIVLVLHRDRGVRYVSPSVERILGIAAETVARTALAFIHPDDAEAVAAAVARVEAGGPDERLRVRGVRADDTTVPLDLSIANRYDDADIGGLLLSARDVVELVETEERLGRTSAWLEAIVSHTPDVSLLLTEDGTVLFASGAVSALLGYDTHELIGSSAFDFVHPDDRDEALRRFADFTAGLDDSEPILRIHKRDGSWLLMEVLGTDASDDEHLAGYVITLRDVTVRAQTVRRYDHLLRHARGAALLLDDREQITWSAAPEGFFPTVGPDADTDDQRVLGDIFEESALDDVRRAIRQVLARGPGTDTRLLATMQTPAGQRQWVDVIVTNGVDDPAIDGVIVNVTDVDAMVRAGDDARRLTAVLEQTSELVTIFDPAGNMVWANPAAIAVLGPPPQTAEDLRDRTEPLSAELLRTVVRSSLQATGAWQGELEVYDPDGRIHTLEITYIVNHARSGQVESQWAIGRDISDRRALEAELRNRAKYDPLTGFTNRIVFTEALAERVADGHADAVVVVDIDQLKAVNDTRGHDIGDLVLIAAAQRLENSLRPGDVAARLGGDEFAVVLADIDDPAEGARLAAGLLDAIRGPYRTSDFELYLTASAGWALGGEASAIELLSRADAAMFEAKSRGRDQVAAWSPNIHAARTNRLEMAHRLRTAIEHDEFEIWFQPIMDAQLGVPASLESLIRWRDPERGLVSPDDFVPVAEESGLIHALGQLIIDKAMAEIASLGPSAHPYSFSINVSARQLTDSRLPEALVSACDRHAIDPDRVIVEVTETAVMHDVTASATALAELRTRAFRVSIDDFGTGYSSLAYLQRFPVTSLKIDREFVRVLTMESEWDHSLAAGIISLGHSLGLHVVAEGVETVEQADILSMLGCDALQGYLFAPPTPASRLPATLQRLWGMAGEIV